MKVNGKEFSISELENPNIMDLVRHFNLKPAMVAIERNGSITERSAWHEIVLENNDEIELIRFIGGG